MNDIKSIIAKNISSLRQKKGLTQLELAERLNYSDKAVSKWEIADSMPDISVLVELADLFEVPLDYLVRAEHPEGEPLPTEKPAYTYRKGIISAVSVLLVWFIAVLFFVLTVLFMKGTYNQWLFFIYAIPVSMIVWLVFNTIWFNPRFNYVIISVLMWTVILSIHLTVLTTLGMNIWLVYLLGIPGQLIIILWSVIKRQPKRK